jgi:hypothetical protein
MTGLAIGESMKKRRRVNAGLGRQTRPPQAPAGSVGPVCPDQRLEGWQRKLILAGIRPLCRSAAWFSRLAQPGCRSAEYPQPEYPQLDRA